MIYPIKEADGIITIDRAELDRDLSWWIIANNKVVEVLIQFVSFQTKIGIEHRLFPPNDDLLVGCITIVREGGHQLIYTMSADDVFQTKNEALKILSERIAAEIEPEKGEDADDKH